MVRSPFLIILFLILSLSGEAAETSIGTVKRIQAQVDALRAADVATRNRLIAKVKGAFLFVGGKVKAPIAR